MPEQSISPAAREFGRRALDFIRQGRWADAEYQLQQALVASPDYLDACVNLGGVYYHQEKFAQAIAWYRQAIRLDPNRAEVHSNLGTALSRLDQHDAAVASCRRALELNPEDANASNNLGNALQGLELWDEAVSAYREALRRRPEYHEAHRNLGVVLIELRRFAEAEGAFRRALQIQPDYPEALWGLGATLSNLDRIEEGIAQFRRALVIKPGFPDALYSLGVLHYDMGKPHEAIRHYEEAIQALDNYPDAHYGRALALLQIGDYERGWPAYESRLKCKMFRKRVIPYPRWNGASFVGKTLLVHAEQGLGDTLQFARYLPLVKALGGNVIVEAQVPLLPLLRTCAGIDQLVAQCDPIPPFDLHIPIPSLPAVLKTRLDTIPTTIPYLTPDPALVDAWRERFQKLDGFKVGIAWHGNPDNPNDRRRSIPLPEFARLAKVPGVRLVSLQKGPGADQLPKWPGPAPLFDAGHQCADFGDTAAAMRALDLIATVDTSVAHCAGAIGAPVWIALAFAPDWRWLEPRETTPWYPTARLFRQPRAGDWSSVFDQLETQLKRTVAAKT